MAGQDVHLLASVGKTWPFTPVDQQRHDLLLLS